MDYLASVSQSFLISLPPFSDEIYVDGITHGIRQFIIPSIITSYFIERCQSQGNKERMYVYNEYLCFICGDLRRKTRKKEKKMEMMMTVMSMTTMLMVMTMMMASMMSSLDLAFWCGKPVFLRDSF